MERYDAVIIGFGKGGKTLAAHLGKQGKSVALIEKSDKMYGGTCINVACIPTKYLIRRAKESAAYGGSFGEKARRYAQAIEDKDRLTEKFRQKNYDKLNGMDTVRVIDGEARFAGPKQVEVEKNGKTQLIEGGQIFINTGSVPFLPPIEGLEGNPYVYTSESLMQRKKLPAKLLVVGGGYIGLEFASMYADFGSQVTVLQDSSVFLSREDEDVAREVKRMLEEKGVAFRLGAQLHSIREQEEGAVALVRWDGREYELSADAVLVATGRVPNTQRLALDRAGIETTERGGVRTDSKLRTNVPGVWAMGDVRGGLQFTYISLDDFRIVWSQLAGGRPYTLDDRKNVPNSVFLDPPLSTVGLKEKEARAKGIPVRIAKIPAASIPKAKVLGESEGFLKAVIDADTDRILGAALLCAESHEIINLLKLAVDLGVTAGTLYGQVFTHPAMSEGLNDLFAPAE